MTPAARILRLALAVPLALVLYAGASHLSPDAETIAGLRAAALLGTAGAAYGCFGALLRSQPRWLAAALATETACLALQLGAAWWIACRSSLYVAYGGRVNLANW